MHIDWNVLATIAAPIIALFVGGALDRYFARPRLISYLGHVSGIALRRTEGDPLYVNTHAIVIRNSGRKTANNVRIGHLELPDFQVTPDMEYSVADLPGGGREIRIPKLIPDKQVTITYLYFPPVSWNGVNTHAESDEGPIKIVTALPTVQLPKWAVRCLWFLISYGVLALMYSIYLFAVWTQSSPSSA